MIITKADMKILKFVYSNHSVSFGRLKQKFSKRFDLSDSLEILVYNKYLTQIGGSQDNMGNPIPITDETIFTMDSIGAAEVESKQWFNTEYVVSHILVPIILAVLSTLLTLILTSALSPSLQTNQSAPLQLEQNTQQ